MELESEAASGDERLRADVGLSDQLRSRREGERVEVPLEPRSLGDQLGIVAANRQPADLRDVAAEHVAAEHARQHLAAEAETEHGDVGIDRPPHESRLARHERHRVVERRALRAERDDEVVVGRVDLAFVDVDPERLDDRPMLIEPLVDEPGRGRLFVLDDQGPQRRRCLARGTHRGPPVGDRRGQFRLDLLRDVADGVGEAGDHLRSSSSVAVKAGANSDWSPA